MHFSSSLRGNEIDGEEHANEVKLIEETGTKLGAQKTGKNGRIRGLETRKGTRLWKYWARNYSL